MSTASRVFSGSIASWAQIAVTMATQVALVPIYLSHWNLLTYGTWLAIQSLVSLISTIDFGHQEFLAYEFLRIGNADKRNLSKYLWSGIAVGILISALQIIIILIIVKTEILSSLLDKNINDNSQLLHEAAIVLIFQMSSWLVSTSATGLLFRVLAPFGYFPRMIWWNLLGSIITTIVPLIAVILGENLMITGIAMTIAGILVSVPIYIDLFRIVRKEKISFCKPNIQLGIQNFVKSLAISSKEVLDNIRQQGARLVLAPLVGATGLAAFSTMRTGSNVALQGLRTIINPLMPELMRFLHQRDQPRSEVAFSTVWLILITLMAPGVVVLQAIVEPFYNIWTRGRVEFNPLLFSALSASVLVYAIAQPAMAVVKGNNLLKEQVLLSVAGAAIVIGGIILTVPIVGIVGSGIALLVAELVATIGYKIIAQNWLGKNGLRWPHQLFNIAATAIIIATISMGLIVLYPQIQWYIVLVSIVAFAINIWLYWQAMPILAVQHVLKIVSKFSFISNLLPVRN